MSAAPRPGHGKGSSWWTCSASGMAAAKRLSWFPEPPPHCFSVLWWGVLGLHSHPEPGHRGNQSAFPLLSQSLEGQGRFVLDGYLSHFCLSSTSPVQSSCLKSCTQKCVLVGRVGKDTKWDTSNTFLQNVTSDSWNFTFMDLLSLSPLLQRSCTLHASKYSLLHPC